MAAKQNCVSCHRLIPFGTVYCQFCGAEQNTVGAEPKKTPHNIETIEIAQEMVPVPVPVPVKKEEVKPEPDGEKDFKAKNSEEEIKPEVLGQDAVANETKSVSEEKTDSNKGDPDLDPASDPKNRVSDTENGISDAENGISDTKNGISEEKTDSESKKKPSKKELKQLEYDLNHDELTGIYNRRAFDEKTKDIQTEKLCVIEIDANGLKRINDTMGHQYGDKLLKEITEAMKNNFGDNCYRIGGDEFVILLENLKDKNIEEKLNSFDLDLKRAERRQNPQMPISVAVGKAVGRDGRNFESLLKEADNAMYTDKQQQKKVYDPNFDNYYDDTRAEYEELKVVYDRTDARNIMIMIIACLVIAGIVLILNFL